MITDDKTEPTTPEEDIFEAVREAPEPGASVFDGEVEIQPGDPDLHDHSAELEARREHERGLGVEIPDPPEHKDAPVNNPAVMGDPVRDMRDRAAAAFSEVYADVKVEVTPDERDRFVRAALHDTEMVFDVKLEGIDTIVKVAIPTESFTASTPLIIDKWHALEILDVGSSTQFLLAFQQLHVWYQVRQVGGTPTAWSTMFADGVPKLKELLDYASVSDNLSDIREMSGPRWRAIIEAVRIAELKYKMCLEAWHDRSFFTSAGTE